MGKVYLGEDRLTGKSVAVKMLNWRLLSDPRSLKRFDREARATEMLNHPNIIGVYDVAFSVERQPYIVTEFVNGGNLSEILKSGKRLDVIQIIRVALQVCAALGHAHWKGIVHRDLKPSNIMVLRSNSEHLTIKVVDFGVAKMCKVDEDSDTTHLTKTDEVIGTPAYMSPEQCLSRPLDSRSDIYSLGVVMYHLVAGRPPLLGANSLETMGKHVMEIPQSFTSIGIEGVPFELESIIFKCLRKIPDERFQTMEEVSNDLRKLLSRLDMVGWSSHSEPATVLLSGLDGSRSGEHHNSISVDSRAQFMPKLEEPMPRVQPPRVQPPRIPVTSTMRSYEETEENESIEVNAGAKPWLVPILVASLVLVTVAAGVVFGVLAWQSSTGSGGERALSGMQPQAANHLSVASAGIPRKAAHSAALHAATPQRVALARPVVLAGRSAGSVHLPKTVPAKPAPSVLPQSEQKTQMAKPAQKASPAVQRPSPSVMFHSVRDGAQVVVYNNAAPASQEERASSSMVAPEPVKLDAPHDQVRLNNEGVSAMSSGHYSLAIKSFEQALRLDPGYRKAQINLCNCYHNYALALQMRDNVHEAEAMFKRSLALRERTFGRNSNEMVATLESYAGLLRGSFREDEARAVEHKLYSIKGH